MKIIASFFLAIAALALTSCATSNQAGGGGAGAAAQLGAHSVQKIAVSRMKPGEVGSDGHIHTVLLVLRVDSTIQKGEQVVNATATVHDDGPTGPSERADKVTLNITQPGTAHKEDENSGGFGIGTTIAAPNGKHKTAVAEAAMSSHKFSDAKVTVTVPGD